MAAVAVPPAAALPERVRRYVETGESIPTWPRDLGAGLNQIPRWAWGATALVAGWLAYRAWKEQRAKAGSKPLGAGG